MGFGHGKFGKNSFGERDWSYEVLYGSLPELYRTQDTDEVLLAWAEGQRPVLDMLRRKIRDFGDLRDPLKVRTRHDDVFTLRLGPRLVPQGTLEQRGGDGSVSSLREFSAPTARFKESDIGKTLILRSPNEPTNTRSVIITQVLSRSTVGTDPLLVLDAGPLKWEVRSLASVPSDFTTVRVLGGYVEKVAPGWVISDGYADFVVRGRRQFRVADDRKILTEREGADGLFAQTNAFLQPIFQSPTANFVPADVGKKIVIFAASHGANRGKKEIKLVLGPSTAFLLPPDAPTPAPVAEAGPLTWAILPNEELDLEGQALPRGVVEQEGLDLEVNVGGNAQKVRSSSARFFAGDVGKLLTISGSSLGNAGTSTIVSVLSADTALVSTFFVGPESALGWALRRPTLVGDQTEVTVRAPALLDHLAPDVGIEVDTQESEARQRSWVANLFQWLAYRGRDTAYAILGSISGFQVTAAPLFCISKGYYLGFPVERRAEVGEPGPGRSGRDGSLSLSSGSVVFTAASGSLRKTDVGREIRLRNSGSGNDKLYTIAAFLSTTSVRFASTETANLPDANDGTLHWSVVRLYADRPPTRPRYDEINGDMLADVINVTSGGSKHFRVDEFCWQDGFSTRFPVTVLQTTLLAGTTYEVRVQGAGGYPTSPRVAQQTGRWRFTDPNGTAYFLDTVPVQVTNQPAYAFQVGTLIAPSGVGMGYLDYVCEPHYSCYYCAASKVLLTIQPDTILSESGLATEKALDRALARMELAKPVHLELIPKIIQPVEVTIAFSVTVETLLYEQPDGIYVVATGNYYDMVPGDLFPADQGAVVTVQQTLP